MSNFKPEMRDLNRAYSIVDDNFNTAKYLFDNLRGRVIATAFHEDVSSYGDADQAQGLRSNSLTRITSAENCPPECLERAKEQAKRIKSSSGTTVDIVVVPSGKSITRISGMFFQLEDNSHIAFIAIGTRDDDTKLQKGVLLRDAPATVLYEYYNSIAARYSSSSSA